MTDCDYCGESFADDDAYLDHLDAEHYEELGAIDRRRVDAATDGDGGIDAAPIALGAVLLAAAAIVAYVVFFAGGGGGSAPQNLGEPGSAHYHGTINMTVNGERVDFSKPEYQLQARRFHFERMHGEPNGTVWHAHATGVTLKYAMSTLGIEVTDSSVTFGGTTYREGDPNTTVVVEVNGKDVNPAKYVLKDGDHVHIVVREGS